MKTYFKALSKRSILTLSVIILSLLTLVAQDSLVNDSISLDSLPDSIVAKTITHTDGNVLWHNELVNKELMEKELQNQKEMHEQTTDTIVAIIGTIFGVGCPLALIGFIVVFLNKKTYEKRLKELEIIRYALENDKALPETILNNIDIKRDSSNDNKTVLYGGFIIGLCIMFILLGLGLVVGDILEKIDLINNRSYIVTAALGLGGFLSYKYNLHIRKEGDKKSDIEFFRLNYLFNRPSLTYIICIISLGIGALTNNGALIVVLLGAGLLIAYFIEQKKSK